MYFFYLGFFCRLSAIYSFLNINSWTVQRIPAQIQFSAKRKATKSSLIFVKKKNNLTSFREHIYSLSYTSHVLAFIMSSLSIMGRLFAGPLLFSSYFICDIEYRSAILSMDWTYDTYNTSMFVISRAMLYAIHIWWVRYFVLFTYKLTLRSISVFILTKHYFILAELLFRWYRRHLRRLVSGVSSVKCCDFPCLSRLSATLIGQYLIVRIILVRRQ